MGFKKFQTLLKQISLQKIIEKRFAVYKKCDWSHSNHMINVDLQTGTQVAIQKTYGGIF